MGTIMISENVSLDGVAQDPSTVSRRWRLDRRRVEATAGLSASATATDAIQSPRTNRRLVIPLPRAPGSPAK